VGTDLHLPAHEGIDNVSLGYVAGLDSAGVTKDLYLVVEERIIKGTIDLLARTNDIDLIERSVDIDVLIRDLNIELVERNLDISIETHPLDIESVSR
jgi:hypothetical protein